MAFAGPMAARLASVPAPAATKPKNISRIRAIPGNRNNAKLDRKVFDAERSACPDRLTSDRNRTSITRLRTLAKTVIPKYSHKTQEFSDTCFARSEGMWTH